MNDLINEKLIEIEDMKQVKVLLAVESGSRAWGFPSRDSDYDVRFIYLHEPGWYLSILPGRDVIEKNIEPHKLDISGWDLNKTLVLFRKFNPPLMEWLDSKIIYREENEVVEKLRELKKHYFSARPCIYHYLHMAEGNYRDYLRQNEVWIKKYFYVIRPLLACMWIEKYNEYPPIEFRKLLDFCLSQHPRVGEEMEILLKRKISGEELDKGERIEILNSFIEGKIQHYKKYAEVADTIKLLDIKVLNSFFKESLREVHGDRF